MKRLLLIPLIMLMSISVFAQKDPVATINSDLSAYKYAYIIPTSGVTSGHSYVYGGKFMGIYGGGNTNTTNPSEIISGYLMKLGFTILPSINPELAEQTMIVSYGYTGTRLVSLLSYASGVIIQMHNAQTHELLASFEAEGCTLDQAGDISEAIYNALKLLRYSLSPNIAAEIREVYKKSVKIVFKNETVQPINNTTIRLTYYLKDEFIHEQITTVKTPMNIGERFWMFVHRDSSVCSRKYTVKLDVIDFN